MLFSSFTSPILSPVVVAIIFDALDAVGIVLAAFGVGALVLRALGLPRESDAEFLALSLAAGLGFLPVPLAVLGLFGAFGHARWLLPVTGLATLAWLAPRLRGIRRPAVSGDGFARTLVALMLLAALLGSIAPVTESDSLAYPLPIAQRIASEGAWRFWPDLARSVLPPAHHFLSAALLDARVGSVGLLSAVELVAAAGLIALLARRVSYQRDVPWVACILALGCPAVAFLASSAKEDLLLVTMTIGGALALYLPATSGAAATAGLFAGLAAGAKFTGLPIGLAIVACVPFCSGRENPARNFLIATAAALAGGGLWYGVNLARFGNPFVPYFPSIREFPGTAEWEGFRSVYGWGRSPLDALMVPFRATYDILAYDSGRFGGRLNWINPLVWIGFPVALAGRARLRAYWPLLVISLALYASWFIGVQVIRLLLPAAALLSIPAADGIVTLCRRWRPLRYPTGVALAASAGIVIAVGILRFERYVRDPAGFLERETEHFAAINWMNTNLDSARHRVATGLRSSGYLRIPWANFAPDYQVEISAGEMSDAGAMRAALRRRGFTHFFGVPDELHDLEPWLTPVYLNPVSRLGGVRFFRTPPSSPVPVYTLR